MRHGLPTAAVLLLVTALGGCATYYPPGYYGYGGYYGRYYPYGYAAGGYYDREPGSYEYRYRPYYSSDYNAGFDTYRVPGGGNG